jgi:transposase, IS30 family
MEVVHMPGSRLTYEERELIQAGMRSHMSVRWIASEIGRAPSTVSREIRRNRSQRGYRVGFAHARASQRARRPKAFKLERHRWLARQIARRLRRNWSPEQVAERLRRDHPNDPRWWVSPEAIYKTLYVQGRGELNKELTRHLRRGRTKRKSQTDNVGKLIDMTLIAERPPQADDRRVPGHWEGDLLLGSAGRSQVGMLSERTTRLTLLFPLPTDRTAPTVRAALTEAIRGLPQDLLRSLTWDQGKEMAEHALFTIATGVQVFFCDPGSPWQRGTGENTVGLLRQYLPKNQDLSKVSAARLRQIAEELNTRPRKTLQWDTPAEAYAQLVGVATAK